MRRKRQKRRRQIFRRCFLSVLAVAAVVLAGSRAAEKRVSSVRAERAAAADEKTEELSKEPELYPEELREAAAANPEIADFVLAYPEKKGKAPAETIEELVKGEIPELIQWDERWGYTWYGDSVLGVTGCGPTALSMAAAGLTGNEALTPAAVAGFAEANGYYIEGTGTSWTLMTEGCLAFGIRGEELPLEEARIRQELEAGHPVICSMGPGDFTDKGHFIVLAGLEGDKLRVHDPNSRIRSRRLWDYRELEPQIKNLWCFRKAA